MPVNCLIAQSGGPTAVINSSLYGIIEQAFQTDNIDNIYGAKYGLLGLLSGEYINLSSYSLNRLQYLRHTPGAALGSWRYKVSGLEEIEQIVQHMQHHHIRYFFYIGGNGSMYIANLIQTVIQQKGYPIQVIGVPKTVDNDLMYTDHCPGYGSAAKFLATCVMDISMDVASHPKTNRVTIVETMGRNTGWLAAACGIVRQHLSGAPNKIYIPEVPFHESSFLGAMEKTCHEQGYSIVIVSEGIVDKDGRIIGQPSETDNMGRPQLGGVSSYLKALIEKETSLSARFLQPSIWQRSSMLASSKVDVNEAYQTGKKSFEYAYQGNSGYMLSMQRNSIKEYSVEWKPVPLHLVAGEERKFPLGWYHEESNLVKKEFMNYLSPLINGEMEVPMKNGLPAYNFLSF